MEIGGSRAVVESITVIIGVVLSYFVFQLSPTRRGFFCNDESIRYPYQGETINSTDTFLITFFTGVILITVTEFAKGSLFGKSDSSGFDWREWLIQVYNSLVDYVVSGIFLVLFVGVLKSVTGSLRPTFIAECRPSVNTSDCGRYHNDYITNYVCKTGVDESLIRTSFPSGLAALSAFATVFCIQYIQAKWVAAENHPLKLIKHIFMGLIALGYICLTVTAYNDSTHHPIDLYIGYIIGIAFGIYTTKYVTGLEGGNGQGETQPLLAATSR